MLGNRVTATNAGSFRVQCLFGGNPRVVDTSPVTVLVQPGEPSSVKTSLFVTEVTAGNSVSVGCSVRDANGNIASGNTTVRVTPSTGATVDGRRVTFTKTGDFAVVCMLADQSLIGGDPVTVTVVPAIIYQLKTVLSVTTLAPGGETIVTCPGLDRYENPVNLEKIITLPVDGLEANDGNRLRLTSRRAGTYPVTCAPKEAWVHPAVVLPATLTVLPGPPAVMTLELTPERSVYNLGTRVKGTAKVFDVEGNAITGYTDEITVSGYHDGVLEQTVLSGERIDLDIEGAWTLTASLEDTNITASRTVLADGSAPTIDLTFPQRGQMAVGSGGAMRITGTIKDATGGLASVRINGTPYPVTPGTNELALDRSFGPALGMNRLTIEATDVNDNTTKLAETFIVAPGYKPAAETFPEGIAAHMAKDFLDDGNRTGAANDLATILERFVGKVDIGSYIPSPVVSYSGYDVYLRSVDYDAPKITLAPGNQSLTLSLEITHLVADVYADGFIDADGTVTAQRIRLDVQMGISIAPGGVPKVTVLSSAATVEGLDIDVHWSINWLIDLFTPQISEALTDAFGDFLKQQAPPLVASALASLQVSEGFEIPAFLPGAAPLPVQLAAKPDHTDIDEQGLDLFLATKMTAAKKVPWSTPGSMMRGACFGQDSGLPAWSTSKKLTMGISLDVLNQLLHAVWQGGALEVTLGADAFAGQDLTQYGVTDLAVTLSGHLPPILTDCVDQQLHLQLGELQVDASLKLGDSPLVISMLVAFETTATVSIDADGALSLELGAIDTDDVLIDVTNLQSDLFGPEQEDVVVQLLKDQLLGNLLGELAGQSLAHFPIPEIDLGALDPSLAGQKIALKNIVLDRTKGYLLLQGDP